MARYKVQRLPSGGWKLSATYQPRGAEGITFLAHAESKEEVRREMLRLAGHIKSVRPATTKQIRLQLAAIPYNQPKEGQDNG